MAHIAFVLPSLAGGGAERVALTQIRYFLALGHSVDLVLVKAEGPLLPLVPAEVSVFDLRANRFRQALPRLTSYLRKRQPDVVQASLWPLTAVAVVARMLARSKARLMLVDHTVLSKHCQSPTQRLALRWSVRLAYPRADARAQVSGDAADDLARLSGLPRRTIEVVYNPLDLTEVLSSNAAAEALWGNGGPRIISSGALVEAKDHALLLRAFAVLLETRPSARLMILGEGQLRKPLEALAESLGIKDRVVMSGFVVDPGPYYASADLFVLSSQYEGFGNVLVEALHAGLKVVSTDCRGGPREILDGGQFGHLVPCGGPRALSAAMDEALSAAHDPEKSRRRAAQLSGAAALERYAELMLPSS